VGDVEEIRQTVETTELDLVGVPRRPSYVGRYAVSNQLQGALAHLLASDGLYSRLLQCTTAGKLLVEASAITDALAASLGSAEGDGGLWLSRVPAAQMLANIQADLDEGLPVDFTDVLALLDDISLSIPSLTTTEALLTSIEDYLNTVAGRLDDIMAILSAAYNSSTERFKVELPT
jgi:hypothetical protein